MDINPNQICLDYLSHLVKLLHKLSAQKIDNNDLLHARLTPDMFPLKVQARTAASFALRTCITKPQHAVGDSDHDINTFSGLISYIESVIDVIQNAAKMGPELVEDSAGFKKLSMTKTDYSANFSLPNFFFHLSMVYAIAKQQGYSVTKGDFDGIHQYPEGFSWE